MCVCVCERERERENKRYTKSKETVLTRIIMVNEYKEKKKVLM